MQLSFEYTRIKEAIRRFTDLQVDTDTIRDVIESDLLMGTINQFEANSLLQDLTNIDNNHPAYINF